MASLTFFYRYYFGRCSSELARLFQLPLSEGRSTRYFDRLHDFSVTILDVTRISMFFPRTARLWNSVPKECFSLTYDLNTFNCRFFLKRFPVCCNLFVLLFLVTPCLVVAVQPFVE